MASPSGVPGLSGAAPFDPRVLAQAIIALPLQKQIDDEISLTKAVEAEHPGARDTHNAAVFLNAAFEGGVAGALQTVRGLLPDAIRRAGSSAAASIDTPDPSISERVALAMLSGPVIRQLRGLDAARHGPPAIERIWPTRFDVTIDVNLHFRQPPQGPGRSRKVPKETEHPDPRRIAKELIGKYIDQAKAEAGVADDDQGVDEVKTRVSNQYVFARLEGSVIKKLVEIDQREAEKMAKRTELAKPAVAAKAVGRTGKGAREAIAATPATEVAHFRTIHRIWPDFELRTCINRSVSTVKVDAARNSFAALGEGITWAVMDTGIEALHPHFKRHANIDLVSPYHADFTGSPGGAKPLQDPYGHGTHVAGIIAGEQVRTSDTGADMTAVRHEIDVNGETVTRTMPLLEAVSGMAPRCKLVSLKVLDEFGMGRASSVIAAIAHIQIINGHGRDLKIHGVNLSLGHTFDPKWFACGQSPLCVEVNRLVKSGVVVVVAAGNTGYGSLRTAEGEADVGLDMTINDPGNAEHAITVGSTHRDMPHRYGVSYFSSKGPTGDGRRKPDLIAPGENILSCAAPGSELLSRIDGAAECRYFENSGTSMAAPHVSGAIAAFLSIRGEFRGEPEKVKQIFTSTATDLGRDRYFQGTGLVDLMRAIQSV